MLNRLSRAIVKNRIVILIISLLLLIPAGLGYIHTKVNYDMLTYLPDEIDTMKGQEILKEEFGTGAFAMFITEGMDNKDTAKLKAQIEQVNHVQKVIWYDTFADLSVPMEILPQNLLDVFNSGDSTMMVIIFDDTTSADSTTAACTEIRQLAGKQCFLSGMTAVLIDTKNLADREAPVYVGLAVLMSVIVLSLAMDSYIIPLIFLASIGMAVLYNLGSNRILLGQISYLTKAIAAVLQLGVTMDYSIFLWHSYCDHLENNDRDQAMAEAISDTFSSIIGSSVTTIAGFIALCFMSFTLGKDLGLVMAKGVVIGVVSCVTILPAMILVLDGAIRKTSHRPLLPDIGKLGSFVSKHSMVFLIIAAIALIPAVYGYTHTSVYYNLDKSLPDTFDSIIANNKLADEFDQQSTHVLLISADTKEKDIQAMADEMKQVDGIKYVLGLNTLKSASIPDAFIPDSIRDNLESENWQLILIGSRFKVASDEVNTQIAQLQTIAKGYDSGSMLIGEAPATKDLIEITDRDFAKVSAVSIGIIFLIIALVFRSLSLPLVLVAVIYLGIFINLGIPAYTGTVLPFIASIIVSTIQLGSTVDYAILTTTRYRRERTMGTEKHTAAEKALNSSARSVLVSALAFFAATSGVGMYSNIDMVSSLCSLMARGALISMVCVIFVLPGLLILLDTFINKTTRA